ncbi:MAG: Calx-beta domain-containing protein, partial [Planctomycetota bacterium]
MCRKLYLSIWLVLTLAIVDAARAVEIKADFGGVGTLDATWTQWNAHNGNLTVDGVQFTLSNTNQANGPKIRVGIGDALTMETLGSDDPGIGGVYTLVITNLPAGDYSLDTYFNNPTNFDPPWNEGGAQEVWVNGAMQAGPSPASYQETSENALVLSVSFTSSGTSDVITIEWKNSALPSNWICGFELISTAAMLRFATAESGDFEAVSPAEVEVIVMNADEAQSYTVDYEVIGGTALKDQDYTVTEPATLTFNPGETSQFISIGIIEDGLEEDDETIIFELSSPTGPNAVLG